MATWFVYRSGKKAGPFSLDQLKKLAMQKKLHQSDLLWKEGMQDRINCSLFPEIAVFFENDISELETNQSVSNLKERNNNSKQSHDEIDVSVPVLRPKKKPKEKKGNIAFF